MIYAAVRVLLIGVGVMMAVGGYADALKSNQHAANSRAQLRATQRALAWATVWTLVAAVGVVGWRA